MNQIIKNLNQIGKDYIDDSFKFIKKEGLLYVICGNADSLSDTKNTRKNTNKIVKALKWLELFWIYIEINFVYSEIKKNVKSKNKIQFPKIFFSLSIFQGPEEIMDKHQVFRAEWDNNNDETDYHPQPHWHFHYCNEFISEFEDDTHNEFDQEETNILDFNKFHFAMNGQWAVSKKDVHRITTEDELVNWFSGIIKHIKKELEYLKKRHKL
ncbi:MAG: hypothetical protein Q7J16_04780 [Candidatus Cloacimonadales bacterium]|nr:hypothetical protein [Candidatus Cloacimonadales bacterium]